ncbi:hypothetical protein D3C75_1238140 [compost metagenome]
MNISDRGKLLIHPGSGPQRTINYLNAADTGGMAQAGIDADDEWVVVLFVNKGKGFF